MFSKTKDISTTTKIQIINAIVFPISTKACESWTLKKVDRRKISVFVLWCWGQMLHKGHKQDDPRASQNKDIAGGQNHQAAALAISCELIIWKQH